MLEVRLVKRDGVKYWECNQCHQLYKLDEAELFGKGNHYFCSAQCIAEYDKGNAEAA